MNNQKTKRHISTGLGIWLSIISAVFTCQALYGYADTPITRVIYILMGLALQSSQAFSCSLSAYCIVQGKFSKGLPALCAWIFLFCLSIAGTMGSFSSENKDVNDVAKINSPEMAIIQDKINDTQKRIEALEIQTEECAKRSIISKCVIPNERSIELLRKEKQALQDMLISFKPTYSGDEFYRRLAEVWGCDTDHAKTAMYFLYAIILDLLPAIFLAYSAGLLAFEEKDIYGLIELKQIKENQKIQAEKERLLAEYKEQNKIEKIQHSQPRIKEKIPNLNPAFAYSQGYMPDVPDYAKEQSHNTTQHSNIAHSNIGNTTQHNTVNTATQQHIESVLLPKKIGFVTQANTMNLKDNIAHNTRQDNTTQHKLTQANTTQDNIGTQAHKKEITDYVKTAFAHSKNGCLCGRRKIGELANITQSRCDFIHNKLVRAGLIQVENKKTIPAYNLEETLKRAGV